MIGADTLVVVAGEILGKPQSKGEARDMLRRLSGRTPSGVTGYCICCRATGSMFAETVATDVRFKTLTPVEMGSYIQTGEPFDEAGGYAIQGIGTFLVNRSTAPTATWSGCRSANDQTPHRAGCIGWDAAAPNGLQIRPT